MLSREAEALYWTGRYLERAEATARRFDVQYHSRLESESASSRVVASGCEALLLPRRASSGLRSRGAQVRLLPGANQDGRTGPKTLDPRRTHQKSTSCGVDQIRCSTPASRAAPTAAAPITSSRAP